MFKRARQKILGFLKQGITPQKLAQTIALGLFFGTIPLLGTTSLLCAFAALRLKLNMAVIQAVNYALYPVQLLLFIPFIKIGILFFGSQTFDYSVKEVLAMLSDDVTGTISKLFVVNIYGVAVWLAVMPAISFAAYLACKRVFSRRV